MALDIATLGAGSIIKGGIKTIGTELVEEGIEMAAKDAAKTAAKEAAEAAAKKSWLEFHEGIGHTIERHVGKTDAELISRLSSSRISGASTFSNQNIAESIISSTISSNRAILNTWLKSGSTRNLVLEHTGSSVIGRGISRGQDVVSDLTNARVILKPNGSGGYNILTAFPK